MLGLKRPLVAIAKVKRVWPILVTHGDLLPAEPLFTCVA